MGHPYFLADYLVFVKLFYQVIVFIPSIVLSFIDDTYNRKHLVFSLTTFLKAKKDGAPGVADVPS